MSKKENLGDLITDNKENAEKLSAADIKVASDKDKTEKKISKLILENKQNARELSAAYKIITIQKKEIEKQEAEFAFTNKELILAKEKEKLVGELTILNKELNLQINERKKTEELVNLQKIKLELALQSSRMGTWEFDIVKNKRIFDNQACVLLGIDSATFGGTEEEFYSVVHPEDHEKVRRALEKAIEQDVFYKPEFRTIWHDGSTHHITARGKLLHDDKGNPQVVIGIIWDNTDNKQIEEELKNNEARHCSMISNISDVIGIIGLDGLMKYKSPNIEKWFGWQPQDLVGTDGWLTVHPDDLERIQQEFVTILEKENLTTKVEFRYKCKNGSYKPVELYAINLTNDPIINGILLNYHDITKRKQTESALQESEEKFRTFVDTATDLMIITDKNGQLTDVNKAVVNILGYSADELMKMHIPMLLTEDSRKNEFEPYWWKFIKEGNIEIETTFRTKSGNEIFGELKAVAILDSSGNFSGTKAVFFDLTHRKLTELELIKAKEKAEESDRLKSAFLNNMSHEIRTPMNGILGFAELLKEPNLSSDDQQDYIQTIQISGARMLNTINNIVDISKIESGLIKVDIKETNINEKIEFTYKFFKPEAEIKGLQFLFKNGLHQKKPSLKQTMKKYMEY